ncbi:PstS family phosphate ABC transporter substrate-binding protein [Cryobacterium cryoconiti]|uniref:Phosphate-binding protein n=1 Tax=Cryobacterium cryoconiti TaxID=1259239 RepID=A0A4Y8JYE7_9MICO|nr:PstS family phosphate ABC transporter substrate-binding protein [Cryobacterium cryoconiti]TFD31993.1 PstS family phosphate ABC transporter substrate-binding protein [Cryobacterium cryoconiti]
MSLLSFKTASISASVLAATLLLTACGGQTAETGTDSGAGLSGSVTIDGSSTVAPLSEAAATLFREVEPDVNVTVATSGTGGGFKAFCAGETDISDASRPIKDEEIAACEEAGIEYTEIVIANDGLSVVVNPENDWAKCLTVEQLKTIWGPESEGTITSWNQVDPSFPDEKLSLFGAGTDSGTFDYFTEAINGEEGAIRTDYSPSEDDNITVQGVSGSAGAMGFFGLSYVEENEGVIQAVEIDGGEGCVSATAETVQDGSYQPLGRELFIYVNNTAYSEKEQLRTFVDFYLENEADVAEAALFVGLTDEQRTTAQDELASLG